MTNRTITLLNQNIGSIIIRLIDKLEIDKLSFPANSLQDRILRKIQFNSCYFQPSAFSRRISECTFSNCHFDRLDIDSTKRVDNVILDNTNILTIGITDEDYSIYQPEGILRKLKECGFIEKHDGIELEKDDKVELDQELIQTQRVIRIFLKQTAVNENLLKRRSRDQSSKTVLKLVKGGLLEEISYRGRGDQKRFRLKKKMSEIENALSKCNGTMDDFIKTLNS